jgi:hypothetical protein
LRERDVDKLSRRYHRKACEVGRWLPNPPNSFGTRH